jgi:hypothetical protein
MANDRINTREHAIFIWSIAELLPVEYKEAEYGKVTFFGKLPPSRFGDRSCPGG